MPERIRFHLDKNVDPDIALALRRAGIDVATSQEANLLAKGDLVQLDFARTQLHRESILGLSRSLCQEINITEETGLQIQ